MAVLRVRVRVPATSANLGPGFDCAGLCLSLYDEVTVSPAPSGLAVSVAGEGQDGLSRGEDNLLVRSLRAAFDRLGGQPPGLSVHCSNRIPQARGLGSSSAAIVAGVLAARAMVEGGPARLDDAAVLDLCAQLEGHPDNVAACLRGGFTLAWQEPSGPYGVLRRDMHPDLLPVVFVPPQRSSTEQVRALLPDKVPHADAAANAGYAALLALALTAEPALLLAATRDLLHQPYRAPAMPRTAELVRTLRAAGVAAVVSGAGPSVLALCLRAQATGVVAAAPPGWVAAAVPVDPRGAVVLP